MRATLFILLLALTAPVASANTAIDMYIDTCERDTERMIADFYEGMRELARLPYDSRFKRPTNPQELQQAREVVDEAQALHSRMLYQQRTALPRIAECLDEVAKYMNAEIDRRTSAE